MAFRKHLQGWQPSRPSLRSSITSLTGFIDKFRYNAAKASEAQSRIKKLEKLPVLEAPDDEYTVHFTFPEVEKLSPPIIQMSGKSTLIPTNECKIMH